ncbi:MAG: hypothetical protein GY803_00160 [Chloroflexi bacterium]|nr:hypothetical protein [Chloroflexota bacterium]
MALFAVAEKRPSPHPLIIHHNRQEIRPFPTLMALFAVAGKRPSPHQLIIHHNR